MILVCRLGPQGIIHKRNITGNQGFLTKLLMAVAAQIL